jgi:hypothetical protein
MSKLRVRVLFCLTCEAKTEFIYEEEFDWWVCSMCEGEYNDNEE